MILEITLASFIVIMMLTLIRAFKGPSLYDRILAINTFGTITVLFLATLGFHNDRPDFLDVALVYAMINFIGTLAVLKFTKYKNLSFQESTPNPE